MRESLNWTGINLTEAGIVATPIVLGILSHSLLVMGLQPWMLRQNLCFTGLPEAATLPAEENRGDPEGDSLRSRFREERVDYYYSG